MTDFHSVGFSSYEFDFDKYRVKLRDMSEAELVKEGKTLARLCSPAENFGKPAKPQWAEQLKVCREEWRRRHPKA